MCAGLFASKILQHNLKENLLLILHIYACIYVYM